MTGFADDYSATVIDSTLQGTLDKLEHDAKNILCFMASNCLFANESKTTFMIFSRKESNPPISIKVGNSNILEARKQKLLGVTFTPDLKWKEHIDTLTEKLRHRIYLLRHLSQLIPRTALKIVADGLVTSHIQYGLPLFCRIRLSDLDPKHSEQEKIQVIHNQMIRTLHSLNIKDKVNMKSIRSTCNIPSINQMACQSIVMELRKSMFNNTLPHTSSSLRENCTPDIRTRSHSQNLLRPPICHLSSMASFSHKATKIWNIIPTDLRSPLLSDSSMKAKLKVWFKEANIP